MADAGCQIIACQWRVLKGTSAQVRGWFTWRDQGFSFPSFEHRSEHMQPDVAWLVQWTSQTLPHPGVLKSDVVDNAFWLRTTDITEGPRCGLSALSMPALELYRLWTCLC